VLSSASEQTRMHGYAKRRVVLGGSSGPVALIGSPGG
jgi:hypothetical protein